MLGRFFKLPRIKRFEYKPRYYDERKEALEYRIRQIKLEMGIEDDDPDAGKYVKEMHAVRIKGQMRSNFKKNRRSVRRSNVRLLIILLALLALSYYIIVV